MPQNSIGENLFAEHVAPQARLTAAFAWVGSAGATGVGIGSVAVGYLVCEAANAASLLVESRQHV